VTRVVVVDDQDVVRHGLCLILGSEPGLEVVGQAGDGEAAVREVRRTDPDVVLMDIRMPVLDGIAATRRLVALDPAPRVLVLTTFDLDEYVYEALRAGAAGFVLKDAPAEEIVRAVRAVADGDAVIAPSTTRRLIEEFARSRPSQDASRLAGLTEREREVLTAMARGLSNTEIGRALFISEGTVRTHLNRILTKLQVRDRLQAVVLAYETGLVRPGHAGDGGDPPRTLGR
jgi:DNA-binding NarL/FixJ family response regulator